jgi:ribonuclease D
VPQEKKCHEIVNDLRSQEVIAVDCEGICLGVNGTLCLIQIATASHVYVFDICSSSKADIVETLKPIFESNKILKVLHGAENDLVGLSSVGIVNDNFEDTQALYEILAKDLRKMKDAKSSIGLQSLMEVYGFKHELKAKMKKIYKGRSDIWAKRPLTEEMIEYAACDVASLTTVYKKLKEDINAEIMLKSKTKSMSKKQKSLLAEKTYAGALNNTPLNTNLRLAFTDDKKPDRRLILEGSSERTLNT